MIRYLPANGTAGLARTRGQDREPLSLAAGQDDREDPLHASIVHPVTLSVVSESAPEVAVERRIVTVLFCDLVGFTSLSEALDAEDVATIQDAYFAMVRETVGRYGGRLEKFIGDAAMAVFGLPRARDGDVERAVKAGLAIVGGIQQIGARLGLDDSALRVRVGVNTGEAVTADGGPDSGRVTGDTVNTAARLQTAAEPMTVYVGEATALAVADVADLESAGGLELKGKAEPVPAWIVRGIRAEASRERAMGALRAPTLGREAELAELRAAWHRVAEEASNAGSSSRRLASASRGCCASSRTGLTEQTRLSGARAAGPTYFRLSTR